MRTVTDLPLPVVETADMGITLADGCRLSARVWMPQGADRHPVPAVLEYIPYRKRDGTVARDERMHPHVAGHGYACLRVDMRGNGDSDGLMADEYTTQELADACEVIAWIAAQPWCSGAVGMMGKSWGGFNSLQTAALQPPALKAVISVCATVDRFADDIHFKGGCLLGENLGWGAVMLSFSSRPPDPALRPDWRELWLQRLEAEPFLAPRWARHQARDGYWRHGSVCEDYGALKVPVLILGGWADNYMNTVAHLVENAGAKGIVGPWVHQYPHQAVPGPAIGFLQEALRWWDHWLKGLPSGVADDPPMRVYMLDSAPPDASAAHRPGRWLALPAWPAPGVVRRELALAPGRLDDGAGEAVPLDLPIRTPQHLGLATGEFFPMGLNAEMPGDQAADDALSACFDTVPLAAETQLLGAAQLRFALTSDRPRAFLVARLCDVAPDGRSVRIAHGMLNLCHRDGAEAPALLPVGRVVEGRLRLDQMAYRLAPGHRLRLALSTTCWPFLWPGAEAATLTLHRATLDLPALDGALPAWSPPGPEAAAEWRHRVLSPPRAARRVETDLITGTVALVIEDESGLTEDLSHGLVTGDTMAERWQVHPGDPLSARAEIVWEQHLSRGDWSVRTRAACAMWGDAGALHMTARLEAWEGEVQVFARDFHEAVPRDFV